MSVLVQVAINRRRTSELKQFSSASFFSPLGRLMLHYNIDSRPTPGLQSHQNGKVLITAPSRSYPRVTLQEAEDRRSEGGGLKYQPASDSGKPLSGYKSIAKCQIGSHCSGKGLI